MSRLAVDVERFEDDFKEVMAAAGMGVIYKRDHLGRLLRDPSDMGVTRGRRRMRGKGKGKMQRHRVCA